MASGVDRGAPRRADARTALAGQPDASYATAELERPKRAVGAKRSSIDEFSAFRLNRDIVLRHGADGWDEARIAARGAELIAEIEEIWPGPTSSIWSS